MFGIAVKVYQDNQIHGLWVDIAQNPLLQLVVKMNNVFTTSCKNEKSEHIYSLSQKESEIML